MHFEEFMETVIVHFKNTDKKLFFQFINTKFNHNILPFSIQSDEYGIISFNQYNDYDVEYDFAEKKRVEAVLGTEPDFSIIIEFHGIISNNKIVSDLLNEFRNRFSICIDDDHGNIQ